MGIKIPRKKPAVFILTLIYRLHKLLPLRAEKKFRLYLNLEWIFDRLAHEMSFKIYKPADHPIRLHSKPFILQQITPQSVVLDLGCNLGEITHFIAEKAAEVTGIDYSEKAIAIARSRYQRDNLSFVHAEALGFLTSNKKKFDTLILSHILEHLDEPETFLMRHKDFFKQIYIELPDFDRYYLNQYRVDQKLKLIYSDNDHVTEFNRYELMDLLERCGLQVVRSEYIYGLQKVWCRVA
ncbi:MAG: metW [Bacteroidetes bacterium]|jgi:SAM-dependent methyltransferase|nr:metW [Bacteroidota bacterium]